MNRIALAVLIGSALLLVWAAAPAAPTSAQSQSSATAPVATAPSATEQAIDRDTARLREWLAHPPQFPVTQRNPFDFGAAHAASAPAKAAPPPAAPVVPVAVPAVPAPDLPRLVAVFSNPSDAGAVRSAAIAIDDDVRIVKVGQVVAGFTVGSIADNAVELVSASGAHVSISLK